MHFGFVLPQTAWLILDFDGDWSGGDDDKYTAREGGFDERAMARCGFVGVAASCSKERVFKFYSE